MKKLQWNASLIIILVNIIITLLLLNFSGVERYVAIIVVVLLTLLEIMGILRILDSVFTAGHKKGK